jgi:ABC-type uncharacterized transport system auxiliary subunit
MVTKITRRALLLGTSGTAALAGCTRDDESTETTTSPTKTAERTTEESQSQSNVLVIQSDEQYTIQKDSSESYSAVKVHDDGALNLESNAALRLTHPSE